MVIVPDNQLSLAIGKEGQNARLAARLTSLRIDIKSESQLYKQREAARRKRPWKRRQRCSKKPRRKWRRKPSKCESRSDR